MKSSGQRHEYLVLTEFLLARIKPKANSSIVTSFIKCTKCPQEVSKCSLKKKGVLLMFCGLEDSSSSLLVQ